MSGAGAELVLEVEGLTKRYGTHLAVDRLGFAVARERITGFLGRNGAGKSTTLKMLLGMIAPTSGTARLLGERIDDPRGSLAIRRQIAYVGEDKGLYGYMTVGELLRFTRGFYDDWSPEHEARLMDRYALPRERKVKALSKGMRTKLALLLALARRSALLVLDEPTDGLDPVSIEELLQELVRRAADGTTVFFSSHQLADVERIADDVVMIERGRVVLEASLDELREGYRSVTIGFTREASADDFRMPGVYAVQARGRQLAVQVSENADAVVARAHALGAASVQVSGVSLREVFLERVAAAAP